ncbi:hypothetical protein D3C86_1869820 [compost metagenome]
MQDVQSLTGLTILVRSWLRRIGTGHGSFEQSRRAQLLAIVEDALLEGAGKKLLDPTFQGVVDLQRFCITLEGVV